MPNDQSRRRLPANNVEVEGRDGAPALMLSNSLGTN